MKHTPSRFFCLAGAALIAVGVQAEKFTAGGISFEEPNGWQTQKPSSSMRKAQFVVKGKDGKTAEVVFFHFGPGAAAFLTHEFEDLTKVENKNKYHLNDDEYSKGIQQTVLQLAELGSIVIVGRGSNIILKDDPRVLRIGLIANEVDRINRIANYEKVTYENAKTIMLNRDAARIQFFKNVFNIEDPDNRFNYHAIINTSEMNLDLATDIIIDMSKDLHLDTI